MRQNKQIGVRKQKVKPAEVNDWILECKLICKSDPTQLAVNWTTEGNISGLIHSLRSHVTFFHYNLFTLTINNPTRLKYASQIHPLLIAKGNNKAIFNQGSNIVSSLKNRAVVSPPSPEHQHDSSNQPPTE